MSILLLAGYKLMILEVYFTNISADDCLGMHGTTEGHEHDYSDHFQCSNFVLCKVFVNNFMPKSIYVAIIIATGYCLNVGRGTMLPHQLTMTIMHTTMSILQ